MTPAATPATPRPARRTGRELRVLLAGGGTAGHVNPLLATAEALRRLPADVHLGALGTAEGLESRLVPEAGLDLFHVTRVPLPRRPSLDLLRVPDRLVGAVRDAGRAIDAIGAQVVVGFGGYVATPAYLAARRRGLPVVVHEQNALAGLANKVGARFAHTVALTFPSTPLRAARGTTAVTGLPLRGPIAALARARASQSGAARARTEGAAALGLDPSLPTLLVTGGSLGAQRLNEALADAALDVLEAGVQVLHLTGAGKAEAVRAAVRAVAELRGEEVARRYHVLEYLGTMEHAYAAADLVVCRAGAGTVAEVCALGLPAVYVPLPIGNGEQARNAADVVAAGGARLIADEDFTGASVRRLVALVTDDEELAAMARRAAGVGPVDGARDLAALVALAAAGDPHPAQRYGAEA